MTVQYLRADEEMNTVLAPTEVLDEKGRKSLIAIM